MSRWLALFCLALLAPLGAFAGEVTLTGPMVQGGLIVGHAAPGSVVFLDGLEVRVDEEGRFVFGLDRDQPEDFRLWVIAPSGDEETYIFQAEQRDYDTQRIDGLAPRYVSPPEEVLERIAREREMIAKVRAMDRVSVDSKRLGVAGHRTHHRGLRQPAHLKWGAASAALRHRYRSTCRCACARPCRRAGGVGGARPLLHRRHGDHRPRRWRDLRLPAFGKHERGAG